MTARKGSPRSIIIIIIITTTIIIIIIIIIVIRFAKEHLRLKHEVLPPSPHTETHCKSVTIRAPLDHPCKIVTIRNRLQL